MKLFLVQQIVLLLTLTVIISVADDDANDDNGVDADFDVEGFLDEQVTIDYNGNPFTGTYRELRELEHKNYCDGIKIEEDCINSKEKTAWDCKWVENICVPGEVSPLQNASDSDDDDDDEDADFDVEAFLDEEIEIEYYGETFKGTHRELRELEHKNYCTGIDDKNDCINEKKEERAWDCIWDNGICVPGEVRPLGGPKNNGKKPLESPKKKVNKPLISPKIEAKPLESPKNNGNQPLENPKNKAKPSENPKNEAKPLENPKKEAKSLENPKNEAKPLESPKNNGKKKQK
ncbi:hypothetical protein niasHS_009208 [Heterodera schachtii]|uniref:Uncharacterized protein n=1 Tax=Heterodera schachtii TaxID=97005 RepID=A0ABD2J368_HETSC